jgi:hypothetical protein
MFQQAMGLPDMGLPDDIQSEELFFHLRVSSRCFFDGLLRSPFDGLIGLIF